MSVSAAANAHNRAVATGVYRDLLRAIGFAFKGDTNTIYTARQYARESFRENAKSREGSVEAEEGIEHAKGVAQILRENVVQGSKDVSDTTAPYKLNLHEGIERGDNESIKQFTGTGKSFKSMK